MPLFVGIPVQTVTFSLMPNECHLWETCPGICRHQWVLCLVKYQHLSIGAHSCNKVGLLGHVSSLVNFTLVNHFLLDVEATFGATTVTTDFFFILIVPTWVLTWSWNWVGELDFGDLEVVCIIARCMGTDEETMSRVVLARVSIKSCQNYFC
jgi:hypothetical protein